MTGKYEKFILARRDYGSAGGVASDWNTWTVFRASWGEDFNNIYRVAITPATKQVDVICLGMDTIDAEAEGIYADTSQLPDWIQGKLAVLALMRVDPPQTKVEGVGMRVDQDTYWVIGVRDHPKTTE